MAMRSVALCNGEYIGIETIYTVIDGCQINIKDKVEALREKSRHRELFCPCGCGANLFLVAGDKHLREQHFRMRESEGALECHWQDEGKTSIDSKIVIKCWLEDKLKTNDIETRVQIRSVDNIERKYEFSFLSKEKRVAVNYCHYRANLSDEKLEIINSNSSGISIIHIVDKTNTGTEGQYPESLMKIQKIQGYCLLLSIKESDYNEAYMSAIFYEQDLDGFWREIEFVRGDLKSYNINPQGEVVFEGVTISDSLLARRVRFNSEMEKEKKRREEAKAEAERKRQELIKQQARIEEENRKIREKLAREKERIRVEEERKRAEQEEQQRQEKIKQAERIRQEEIRLAEERRARQEELKKLLRTKLEQQDEPVIDEDNNRWVKCEFCGLVDLANKFKTYGGAGRVNLGTCYKCAKNIPIEERLKRQWQDNPIQKMKYNPNLCPEPGCGGILKEINGRFGSFLGCSNYPRCRYTRKLGFKEK